VTNLFEMNAYEGRELRVSDATHIEICELFPEIDVYPTYRDAESWINTCSPRRRPKNIKRFLMSWFRKEKRVLQRERRKQIEINRELHVGEFRY
jgi:hypothetical protein